MNINFVHTSQDFPYTYYLSVMSAMAAYQSENTGNVCVWTHEIAALRLQPWFKALETMAATLGKPRLTVLEWGGMVDVSGETFPAIREMKPDHKPAILKDYIEWYLAANSRDGLHEFFLDLDTITLSPSPNCLENGLDLAVPLDTPNESDCKHPFNNAIFQVRGGSRVARELLSQCKRRLMSNGIHWGDTGPALLTDAIKKRRGSVYVVTFGRWGAFGGNEVVQKLYGDGTDVPDGALVIHCFAVQSQSRFTEIEGPQYILHRNNAFSKAVRRALPRKLWEPGWEGTEEDIPEKTAAPPVCVVAAHEEVSCQEHETPKAPPQAHVVVILDNHSKVKSVSSSLCVGLAAINEDGRYTLSHTFDPREHVTKPVLPTVVFRTSPHFQLSADLANQPVLWVDWNHGGHDDVLPHRVFPSYSWMHYLYGKHAVNQGRSFDCVIYPEVDRICLQGKTMRGGNSELVLAGPSKLLHQEVAEALAKQVKWRCRVVNTDTIGPDQLADAMMGADAVMVQMSTIGPWSQVAAQATALGIPVLSPDWGAYPEIVLHGVTGWRCRTWDDYVFAINHVQDIDSANCVSHARNFTHQATVKRLGEYLRKLLTLWGDGWNTQSGKANGDWLKML